MQPFHLDKAQAVIYEAIAADKIVAWYRLQGKLVEVRSNPENGLTAKRAYDLVDHFGVKFEVKTDRRWHETGNIYLEHQALEHSQADYYVIIAGLTYIVPRQALLEVKNATVNAVPGGDGHRSLGTLLKVSELARIADIV